MFHIEMLLAAQSVSQGLNTLCFSNRLSSVDLKGLVLGCLK